MDPFAFDTLARSIAQAGTRRRLLRRLVATLPLGSALLTGGGEEATAGEHPRDRLRRRTKQRNRKQRNTQNSNQNSNQNQNNNQNQKNNQQNNGGGLGDSQCGSTGDDCTQNSDCCSNNCF